MQQTEFATIRSPSDFIHQCHRYGRSVIIDANGKCMSEETKKPHTNCEGCRFFREG